METVLTHLQNEDLFSFRCAPTTGSVSCGDAEGLASEFYWGYKNQKLMAHLDETGQRLLDKDGKRFWKAMLFYTDRLRKPAAYPMSKTDTDIMPFMKAYFADHVVHYSRSGQRPA